MALRIISADERLSAAANKTSFAIFGPPGIGKTTLLKTLPEDETVCLDLEAGMKSVQDWRGASIPVRSFGDFRDLAVLIGGADPAQDDRLLVQRAHHRACPRRYPRQRPRGLPRHEVDRLRRLDHRPDPPGDGLRQAAAGGLLRRRPASPTCAAPTACSAAR